MPKRVVTILCLSDGHDSGAAIIRDGQVLAAVQEERLNGIKHYDGTPERSIREVFRISRVESSNIDLIAITNLVRVHAPGRGSRSISDTLPKESQFNARLWQAFHMLGYVPFVSSHTFAKLYVLVLHKFREMNQLKFVFEELNIADKEVAFIEHHLSHASCAYHSSPWSYDEPVLVLTADGAGDGLSSTVSIGEKGELRRIASSTSFDSLGNTFYGSITGYLGLKPWHDEYKTMGLAPYGNPHYCAKAMRRIIRINTKKPLEFQNIISPMIQTKLSILLARQRFDNIAAATQEYLEELLTAWIKAAIAKTNIHKIACAGGIFLNVKANKKIAEMPEVDAAFFYPAAGDDGTTIGCGLQAYYKYCRREGLKPEKVSVQALYYGPEYSNEEIELALKETGWNKKAQHYSEIDSVVGSDLAIGKIVGRLNGRLEWGPRALGNRSILADPRNMKIIHKLNSAVKHRDFWMPFAPTILENRMAEYLVNARSSPYMILAFDTTDKRDDIVAGVHPWDKTCRPQTLAEDWNQSYFKVVDSFQQKTGVGGILNTSFNLHRYPIVCNPMQAIWAFENSGLDCLALGNYYISK